MSKATKTLVSLEKKGLVLALILFLFLKYHGDRILAPCNYCHHP